MADIKRRDFLKMVGTTAVGGSLLLSGFPLPALSENVNTPVKVRAAVFSPTGGTMNATYLLASMLCDKPEMIDQTPLSSRDADITFARDELAIFAAPCYAKNIPYAPNLFTNLKGDQTPCVLVASYGNRAAENSNAQMKRIAEENGFVVIGAIKLVTPHIFAATAGHSRPDIGDHDTMREFAAQILEKIQTGNFQSIFVEGDSAPSEKLGIQVEKEFDASKCIQCGECVKCPVGAVDPKTLAINDDLCIECQRCSHVCPVYARTYVRDWAGGDAKYFAPRNEVTYEI